MKKIAFIVPYYGKFPNYFELWLLSCKYNETIDWLIFTDNKTPYKYPQNVKIFNLSFQKLKILVQKAFDFPITLNHPYKLCDYKPAYGLIFNEWLKHYDFWGYCDIDLIFGDIRKFITDEILNNYKKILKHGHFTIIKNDIEGNNFFKLSAKDRVKVNYKEVYTSNNIFAYDEHGGISPILDANRIKQYYSNIFADVFFCYDFLHLMFIDNEYVPQIFIWSRGKLFRKYYDGVNINEQEFMYIHLQKREMKIAFSYNEKTEIFMIGPHKFFMCDMPNNFFELMDLNPFKLFYFSWMKRRTYEIIKDKLKRIINYSKSISIKK